MILYETLGQPELLMILCLVGFASGIIFDFANFVYFLCDKNKFARIVLDVVASLVCFVIFFVVVLNLNYGDFRVWQILFFVASLLIQRAFMGKVLAKVFEICYNYFIKKLKKIFKFFQK